MNSIKSFIKARMTKIKPININCVLTSPIVSKFDCLGTCPEVPYNVDWNWTLKVERAFGDKEEISGQKMEVLRWYVTEEATRLNKSLKRYSSRFKKCEDGGKGFWDKIIFRGMGDTPIAICEHVTPLILLADNLRFNRPLGVDCGIGEFNEFLKMCAEYVFRYEPAVLNNHLTWKALFLLLAGHHLDEPRYSNWTAGAWPVILDQIDNDGYMPLELEREDKSASYTRMNLEALNFLQYVLSRFYGMDDYSAKVDAANRCFYRCLTEHDAWKDQRDIKKQELPDNLYSWAWVLTGTKDADIRAFREVYYNPMARNQNAYIYNFIP